MNLLCRFGYHTGTWVDDPQRGPCAQRRMCTRCTDESRRMVHDHEATRDGRVIYVSDDGCYAKGECTRCGHIGGSLGIVHRWGPFAEVWNDGDQIIARRYCAHCAVHEDKVSVPVDWAG